MVRRARDSVRATRSTAGPVDINPKTGRLEGGVLLSERDNSIEPVTSGVKTEKVLTGLRRMKQYEK
jgi:hypothetical protein